MVETVKIIRGMESIKLTVSTKKSKNYWQRLVLSPPDNPSDHVEAVSASPDHSQPILHYMVFTYSKHVQNKCKRKMQKKKCKSLINYCIAYLKLWDRSKISDLEFLIWVVSPRAHQFSKTPHS